MAEGGVDVQAGGGTSDIIILIIALIGLSVIVGGIFFALREKPKPKKKEKDDKEEEVFVQKGRVKGAARKRGLAGMKKKKGKAESEEEVRIPLHCVDFIGAYVRVSRVSESDMLLGVRLGGGNPRRESNEEGSS
jgi:hypothetical protein